MASIRSVWRGIALLLGGFAALCTLFAAIVTAAEGWRDHVRAGWPQTEARVDTCAVKHYESRGRWYYIRCRISYPAGAERIEAQIDSGNVPAPERGIWQGSSTATFGDLQSWVDTHPQGMTIVIHYDPDSPKSAALVTTDMPLAGPKTPGNLQLLAITALISVGLLGVGAVGWRPRRST
jgi:hypothetical protein